MERLSFEVENKFLSPSTELSAFSRILLMLVSISLAFAPGYVVIMVTYGGSISGNWSIGSRDSENRPITITATKISPVVIGFCIAVL